MDNECIAEAIVKGLRAVGAILTGITIGLMLCMLTSCRTKYVAVPETHTEYITKTDTLRLISRDSIRVLDSVLVERWTRGDTVYVTKDRWHVLAHERVDTVLRIRADTLLRTDTITVIKPMAAELTKSQRRLIGIGKLACGTGIAIILLASAIWWYRRKI